MPGLLDILLHAFWLLPDCVCEERSDKLMSVHYIINQFYD